jgi:chemotaxis protein methyltransferase CheR
MHKPHESLSTADFARLRSLIYKECGISLGAEKKTMLEIRLRRRLFNLNFSSCTEYCNYLFGSGAQSEELLHLVDAVTTNKTDFFREPDHFEHLVAKALPDLAARNGTYRRSLVWSAGCSSGEEAYTLAMILNEYAQGRAGFRYNILATDICTSVLKKAALGIFGSEDVKPVPVELRKKYLMRSRDPKSDLFRVVPELRSKIEFRRLNFMDSDFGLTEPVEVIFCRNVIIYFDRPTQIRLLEKLTRHLVPGGYFFSGHSESLHNMDLPLIAVGAAVYRKER